MNPSAIPLSDSRSQEKGIPRLAIASLVLGILAMLTSLLVLGAILGAVGLILGIIHLRRDAGARRMGWTGVVLSGLSILIASWVVYVFVSNARQFSRQMRQAAVTGFESWYGKLAPDLEVATLDGSSVRLSDLKGRRVLLEFWASWEPKSVQEVPSLIRLQSEMPEDLTIVAVSGEDRGALQKFATEKGINYTIGCSGRAGLPEPYSGVKMLPTKFYIDRDGFLQHVSVGYRSYANLQRRITGSDTNAPGAMELLQQ